MKTYKAITEKDLPFIEGDEWTTKGLNNWSPVFGQHDLDSRFEYRRPIPSARPFNLPVELPDPPECIEGYRWEYRGKGWDPNTVTTYIAGCVEWFKVWKNSKPEASETCHYLEAVPLRPVPAGVAEVPEGFEYCGNGPLVGNTAKSNPDIIAFGELIWDTQPHQGNCPCNKYALRIGSEIHYKNMVEQKDKEIVATEDYTHTNYLDIALSIIKNLLRNDVEGQDYKDARRFVEKFEPPFDWEALWSSVASWHNFIACNKDGSWCASAEKPLPRAIMWDSPSIQDIPVKFAPPPCTDWNSSLVERPKQ